jgi:hypothetical protein
MDVVVAAVAFCRLRSNRWHLCHMVMIGILINDGIHIPGQVGLTNGNLGIAQIKVAAPFQPPTVLLVLNISFPFQLLLQRDKGCKQECFNARLSTILFALHFKHGQRYEWKTTGRRRRRGCRIDNVTIVIIASSSSRLIHRHHHQGLCGDCFTRPANGIVDIAHVAQKDIAHAGSVVVVLWK